MWEPTNFVSCHENTHAAAAMRLKLSLQSEANDDGGRRDAAVCQAYKLHDSKQSARRCPERCGQYKIPLGRSAGAAA